jgi:putative copper export protein
LAAVPDRATRQHPEEFATPVSIALSAFDIGAQIVLIGLLACRLAVMPREHAGQADRTTGRLLGGALALTTLASFGILLSRTLELNGGAWQGVFADLRLALAVTHFGHVWLWRLPALALLWLAWGRRSRGRRRAWTDGLMVIAAAGIALTRSQTGHPADHGDFMLSVWMDWAHLLAAGTWVGSLFGMSLGIFPGLLRAGEHAVASTAAMFQRLSTLSGAALAVLLGCGIYNAVRQLGSIEALWTTRYGITLDIKLLIVLAMIALGAHNRYVKLPRLLRCCGQGVRASWLETLFRRFGNRGETRPTGVDVVRQCARTVLIESLLGLAVIGTTSVLLHAMPPADMPRAGMVMRMGVVGSVRAWFAADWLEPDGAGRGGAEQIVDGAGGMLYWNPCRRWPGRCCIDVASSASLFQTH